VNLETDSQESVSEYVKEVMSERVPPTAFFGGNNRISRYIYRALGQLGLRIPEDVAVAGFDDFEVADMLQPPLTVVNQPVEQMGKTAAEVLFSQLKMNAEDRPEIGSKTVLKVDLIIRESCGCRPIPHGDMLGPRGTAQPIPEQLVS
jgi:LacI family transcriptional regulator